MLEMDRLLADFKRPLDKMTTSSVSKDTGPKMFPDAKLTLLVVDLDLFKGFLATCISKKLLGPKRNQTGRDETFVLDGNNVNRHMDCHACLWMGFAQRVRSSSSMFCILDRQAPVFSHLQYSKSSSVI